MSGQFNNVFYHGVPPVSTWPELFEMSERNVRTLPPHEMNAAEAVMAMKSVLVRFNVTIRWHQTHNWPCPFRYNATAGTAAAQEATPDDTSTAAASSTVGRSDTNVPLPGLPPFTKFDTAAQEATPDVPDLDTAARFHQFFELCAAVPDWMAMSTSLPMLPSRASEMYDRPIMETMKRQQARYVQMLMKTFDSWGDDVSEKDAAQEMLQRETRKLSVLESRLDVYTIVAVQRYGLPELSQVFFNQIDRKSVV
jgi:hypothetical protein